MGVDFITCENPKCGYNFPDCGNYNFCTGCERYFCSDCGDLSYNEEAEDISTCILCRKEAATPNDLLYFLIRKYGLTYDQVLDDYKKEDNTND